MLFRSAIFSAVGSRLYDKDGNEVWLTGANWFGFNCGKGAEERGQGQAIANNLYELTDVKTPIISVMIGEGGSGGALALAVADEVWMLENAYYSVITPESCASILFKDPKRAPEAAEHLKLTAADLIKWVS